MDIYRQKILDHYRHPRNFGKLPGSTHRASVSNPLCGDEVTLELKMSGGRVQTARFCGRGCAISTAATSLLTETISGKTLRAVKKVTAGDVLKLLGAPITPARHKCALLGYEALRQALGTSDT